MLLALLIGGILAVLLFSDAAVTFRASAMMWKAIVLLGTMAAVWGIERIIYFLQRRRRP